MAGQAKSQANAEFPTQAILNLDWKDDICRTATCCQLRFPRLRHRTLRGWTHRHQQHSGNQNADDHDRRTDLASWP